MPDEDEQAEACKAVAKAMAGKVVTIRTLDIGATRMPAPPACLGGAERQAESAPGLRPRPPAEPQLFLERAGHLRAAHYVRILVRCRPCPRGALALVEQAKAQLRDAPQVRRRNALEVGGMIEIPAAALVAEHLPPPEFPLHRHQRPDPVPWQIDRTPPTEAVAHLYDPLHPAVPLIFNTIQAGAQAGIPGRRLVAMMGDARLTKLLIGMGLRQFLMHPPQIRGRQQVVYGRCR